jgi:glutamate formiminotransferase/formiminotetrahydrofolate cyclodeaminase
MPESDRTLAGYLEAVASAEPAPGGGSVAAITGALGAALGEMVVQLSTGRAADAASAEALRRAGERLRSLREALSAGAAADERAYAGYRVAVALPRATAAEKHARHEAMQQALLEATEAPLAVAQAAAETAEIMVEVASFGNPHLRSDAALGALLAEVALRGALLNVQGNARMLRDDARAAAYQAEGDRLEAMGRAAAARAFRFATEGPDDDAPR